MEININFKYATDFTFSAISMILPRQQISFPEGLFIFSKDIFEGRNQKICDVEKGLPTGKPPSLKMFTYSHTLLLRHEKN